MFWKMDLLLSSIIKAEKVPTQLGLLEQAGLDQWSSDHEQLHPVSDTFLSKTNVHNNSHIYNTYDFI
jgi:hypothetical protein